MLDAWRAAKTSSFSHYKRPTQPWQERTCTASFARDGQTTSTNCSAATCRAYCFPMAPNQPPPLLQTVNLKEPCTERLHHREASQGLHESSSIQPVPTWSQAKSSLPPRPTPAGHHSSSLQEAW